jgi:hypothetical protein
MVLRTRLEWNLLGQISDCRREGSLDRNYSASLLPDSDLVSWRLDVVNVEDLLINAQSAVSMAAERRAVCKVRGLTLLLRVGTLWRCGDGLFFEVPPLASDALLTTFHPLLENVLQTVDHFEISCLGAPFSRLEKPRNRVGRDLEIEFCVGLG